MKLSKIVSSLTAGLVLLSNLSLSSVEAADEKQAMRDMTTMEIVKDMGIGINLGNTFDRKIPIFRQTHNNSKERFCFQRHCRVFEELIM